MHKDLKSTKKIALFLLLLCSSSLLLSLIVKQVNNVVNTPRKEISVSKTTLQRNNESNSQNAVYSAGTNSDYNVVYFELEEEDDFYGKKKAKSYADFLIALNAITHYYFCSYTKQHVKQSLIAYKNLPLYTLYRVYRL